MEDKGIPLEKNENLEDWLKARDNNAFPKFSISKGEKPYPERYFNFSDAILPIHNLVEKSAMAAEAQIWIEKCIEKIGKCKDERERTLLLNKFKESDPIMYLNNHGQGHVNKVIEKVSEMLHFFDRGHLTSYEGFFLLCSIQIHDVGNVFGREEHEKRCRTILEDKAKPFIPDKFERNVIEKLSLVHGGIINGDRDTIGFLPDTRMLHEQKIRKRLLAALLRFGDEMADDSSRADNDGLDKGIIPEGCRIYHHYSASLHTVKIEKDTENEKVQLNLSYEFDSDLATKKLKKNGEYRYLLDEIYNRTLKLERERRYCMRFIRPYFSLDGVRVEIIIQHAQNPIKRDIIRYTLEENGYLSDPPSDTIKLFGEEIRSGEEEVQHLKKEWELQC
ncbi:MAG: hypothetical protein ABFD75_04775 [Smithella sp.]